MCWIDKGMDRFDGVVGALEALDVPRNRGFRLHGKSGNDLSAGWA
jgi:hypothetical protein